MIAVLGGGISGLSIAYQLKKHHHDVVLIEKEDQAGGKIKSIQKEDFTLELGPNTVLINNPEIKTLIDELGLTQQIIQPNAEAVKNRFVLYNGNIEPLPNSFKKVLKSPLIGWTSVKALLKEPFQKRVEQEESLASFARRRLGHQIYNNFIYPFVTGIYAGNPEEMSMDFTLKILKEAELKHGSILMGMPKIMKAKRQQNEAASIPKQKIFTFRHGLAEMINRLVAHLGDKVRLGTSITSIQRHEERYILTLKRKDGEEQLKVNSIVSTLPLPDLKRCCQFDPKFELSLNQQEYVPVFVYHFGYKKAHISVPQQSFGLLTREEETLPFLGILFNSQFFEHTAPEDCELITVITGGAKLKHLKDWTEEKREAEIKRTIEHLFQTSAEPIMSHSYTWHHGIPQYEMNHNEVLNKINDFEQNHPNFYIEGNFKDGISVSDCIANASLFVKKHFA